MSETIIEAAALDIEKMLVYYFGKTRPSEIPYGIARSVLATVTPLIRADALEDAAQRIEADDEDYLVRNEVAAALRALKEQP